MSEKKFHELSHRDVLLHKPVDIKVFWNDSVQCIVTDKGMEIIEFSVDPYSMDKTLTTVAAFIPSPKLTLPENMIPNKFMKTPMSNLKLTQFLINPTLWPFHSNFVQEFSAITSCKWSPLDLVYNNDYALAVLNNLGSVSIFIRSRHGWTDALNLSEIFINDVILDSVVLKDLETIKKYCETVETCAVCWQSKLLSSDSCYFVTAQKNGNILFWKIQSQFHQKLNAFLVDNIQCDICEINNLLWIPMTNDNEFILICCTTSGQVYSLLFQVIDNKMSMIKSTNLWSHRDRMIVKYIEFKAIDEYIVIIYTKHRHLVVQLIDSDCKVLCQYLKNINDHAISTLLQNCGAVYVGTINFKIYRIAIIAKESNLDISLSEVVIKDSYSRYHLINFYPSPNNVIWTLCLKYKEVSCRKTTLKLNLIYLSLENDETEITLLLNNPSQKLTHMWDCIELVRYKIIKNKTMPNINYSKLYSESELNVYKLKLYLLFTIMFNNLKKSSPNVFYDFPEKCVEKIKELILLKHAVHLVNNILEMTESCKSQLNDVQSEVYVGCFNYIKYYCEKHKEEIGNYINPDIFCKMGIKLLVFKCQCCDEDLVGFTCKVNHANQFCSLTFTPIISSDYLVCKVCGATCRNELYPEKPMCVFCDVYMDSYSIPM